MKMTEKIVRCPDCEWAPKKGQLWPTEGPVAVKWFKKNLILPEGSTFGQPFIPRPDQKKFIYSWYEYCGRCDRWRYKEALRGEATGGGKTTLLAGIALLEFAGPEGIAPISPNIVVAAASRGQANNLFRKVGQMAGGRDDAIRESPLCGLFHVFENTIRFKDGRPGEIERVAAEAGTNEGGYPSLFICDELHEWTGNIARNKTVIGKALALDTLIPTPTGWAYMGDICEGDEVFDENGDICRVVGTSRVFNGHDCFEITFADGETIVSDADHQWTLDEKQSGGYFKKKTVTTRDMFDRGTVLRVTKEGYIRHRYRLPVAKALNLPDTYLPVDPYVLGAWLGDGNSDSPNFTVHQDDYDELRASIENAGLFVLNSQYHTNSNTTIRMYVSSNPVGGKGTLTLLKKLRDLNVLGNKHIPSMYLRSSEKQRLALLQGLMDTDGTVSKAGVCSFSNTKKELIDGVCELVASLGFKFSCYKKQARISGRDCGSYWEITFTPIGCSVFRLTRKNVRLKKETPIASRTKTRYITNIRRVASVSTKCISVDSPSRLYLAGKKMIPTHNSTNKRDDLRGEGRILGISTAGFDKNNCLLGEMYKKGKQVEHDPTIDPKFYFTWYEADEELNPDDPEDRREMVKQGSPAAGVIWSIEARVRAWKQPDMPPHEWLRYYANRWVDVGMNSWLKDHPGVWKNCQGEWESNDTNPFTIGVDMALRHDTVGVVRCERLPDERVAVSHKIWRADPMTGRIDHSSVWDYILSIAKGSGFRGVVYDPRYFELPARMLEDRGVLAIQFDQTPNRLAPASGLAYKRILENTIVHNGDPDFADQVNSAVTKYAERGGFYVHKGVSKRNIDACVAMCMALYELEQSTEIKPFSIQSEGDYNFWKPKSTQWGSRTSMWG